MWPYAYASAGSQGEADSYERGAPVPVWPPPTSQRYQCGFRGGLVLKAHRPVYHSRLESKEEEEETVPVWKTFLLPHCSTSAPSPRTTIWP